MNLHALLLILSESEIKHAIPNCRNFERKALTQMIFHFHCLFNKQAALRRQTENLNTFLPPLGLGNVDRVGK
jgi:hypothetical protein